MFLMKRRLTSVPPMDRQQRRVPVANGVVADFKVARRDDPAQVAERQPVAELAEHHEIDGGAGQARPVQHAGAALIQTMGHRRDDG